MSRLPIRARMTTGFALAMVVVIAAAGAFVYLRLQEELNDIVDTGLNSRSDDVVALIRRSGTALVDRGGGRLAESEESFVQILTIDGDLVDGTSAVRDPALPPADVRRAARAPAFFERRVAGVEGTTRMLGRPVMARGQTLVVVAGATLLERDETLSAILNSFVIGGPIAVLLASAIGYALATVGLRPVEAMRARATRISLEERGGRLPLPAADDEIHRLGATLNEMLARLEESFDRERRFVADASHELRTPLAVLKTELETALRSDDGRADAREALVAALEETDTLAQLADDLLLIARAADGRLPVRPERVELRELLERTRDRFADRAREHGRRIDVHSPAGLTAPLDPLRARQALGNLVDNALRHGGGDIELSARRDGDAVEIEVSDAGGGFGAELAPRAFERFARDDGARTRSGAGLGLAIVRAIAEAHGGTATIVDGSCGGATVRLRVGAPAE